MGGTTEGVTDPDLTQTVQTGQPWSKDIPQRHRQGDRGGRDEGH